MRTLGRTGLTTTPLVCGTSPLGRDTARGSTQEAAAVHLATAMLDSDIRLIDTSNAYARGRSEEVLGLALSDRPHDHDRIVTKVDAAPDGTFDRDRVLRSFDESCARLGTDTVPLLHLHDPYTVTFEEAMGRQGAVQGLIDLRDEGRVGAIGIAAGRLDITARYVDTAVFDALLTHNRYTLVERTAARMLERARVLGMGTFNAAPFGGGLLSRGTVHTPASGLTYGYRPASPELLATVSAIEALCDRYNTTLPTAALQFSLRSPLIDATVVGLSRPERLTELQALAATPIVHDFWVELETLRPDGPVLPD